jgi:UDP-GlcNAc:undecaprenyl-phosphate/decaprenyl-phosphate GlcNAc-1-phosphate transferase
VTTLAAALALPAAAATIFLLLRTAVARRIVAAPSAQRWHDVPTPVVGGIGIFVGFSVGIWAAVAVGALEPSTQLLGIYGGAALLFVAGLVDDAVTLPPLAKVGAQLAAAALVLTTGTTVQIVGNDLIAVPLGVLWLVAMTNAFNLLDNMDGLAASLAAIAAAFFAVAAAWRNPDDLVLVVALSLSFACVGFLPFNLRPGRRALSFMGDGGSQPIGFTLAALGLAASYTAAGTTVATLILPILILAVPILDTTLVTVVRLLDGRPVTQGGRDHSSHRLVYLGLSEATAVILLALVSTTLGATSLAYEVLGNGRIAALGVLLTFALLVQFGSFLAAVDRGTQPQGRGLRAVVAHTRRLVEVLVDGAIITASFLAAYLLLFEGSGTPNQRHFFLLTLPVLLFCRFATFIPLGLYGRVWRYAGAHDAATAVGAVVLSEVLAVGVVALTQPPFGDFSTSVFVIDVFICSALIVASRFLERASVRSLQWLRYRDGGRRVLIVGAGRAGRSLLRELRETPGERVVGFVDDDPRLWGRRISGVRVVGGTNGFADVLERSQPDAVLVTVPTAPRDRLDEVVEACELVTVECRFVVRHADLDPTAVLGAGASEQL